LSLEDRFFDRGPRRIRGFLFVYLACLAGTFPVQEPEIFEDMNTSPNQPLDSTGSGVCVLPSDFSVLISASPVSQLVRSAASRAPREFTP